MLVTTAQLKARRDDPSWVIFDCRHDLADPAKGARLYREGHIPNAHFAPVDTALSGPKTGTNGRHPLPTPEAFAAFLAAHGVTADSTLVAYDDLGGLFAARLWWLARWIGLKSVALLDGGLPRWIADQGELTTTIPAPRTGSLTARVAPDQTRDADFILQHLHNPACSVLDARAADRFRGENETIDPVGGHIPGALNRFYRTNLHADLTFRPAAELKEEFSALLRDRPPAAIIHQCGSGITACANIFAMEYAGLSGSKLYPGSWSEWIADPQRPVARGAAQ